VNVVAACVHHRDFLARIVFCLLGAGIGEAGFLFEGQSVKIRPNEHGGTIAILQHGHDAVAYAFGLIILTKSFRHLEPKLPQLRGYEG